MADRLTEMLVDALKQALTESTEQLLYKSGKLEGLFAGRSGLNGDAAARALGEGLLEVVRTETRGKTTLEWVRPTPQARAFLQAHESPLQALKDLAAVLQTTRDGVPLWLAAVQQELRQLADRLAEEAQRWTHRLDSLCQQVEAALRRSEAAGLTISGGAAADAPWAAEALAYLDQRQKGGDSEPCPLPELFAAVREHHQELTVTAFHARLRRLQDRRALRLLPYPGPGSEIPQPEYALLDGSQLLYFAVR
jgi:hypothetical protein